MELAIIFYTTSSLQNFHIRQKFLFLLLHFLRCSKRDVLKSREFRKQDIGKVDKY